jgi:hypothetical protein
LEEKRRNSEVKNLRCVNVLNKQSLAGEEKNNISAYAYYCS